MGMITYKEGGRPVGGLTGSADLRDMKELWGILKKAWADNSRWAQAEDALHSGGALPNLKTST